MTMRLRLPLSKAPPSILSKSLPNTASVNAGHLTNEYCLTLLMDGMLMDLRELQPVNALYATISSLSTSNSLRAQQSEKAPSSTSTRPVIFITLLRDGQSENAYSF